MLATLVEGDPKAPCSIAITPRSRRGTIPFPGLLLIMLSVKQGGIKYHLV